MGHKSSESVRNVVCPKCKNQNHLIPPLNLNFEIYDIQSQEAGWLMKGKGKFDADTTQVLALNATFRCAACGSLYTSLVQAIPIECAPFPCPNCGEQQDLQYTIGHIASEDDSFAFEAKISCKKCGNKKTLKNILQKIL